MVLCFLFAGFSIISLVNQLFGIFWRAEMPEFPRRTEIGADLNNFRAIETAIDENQRFLFFQNPASRLLSQQSITFLFGGIISMFAGLAIWSLLREKEIKSIKHETANNLLLPDEKEIINALKRSDFESTQAKLAKETGLNKVQIHRAIKRLESKGVLEKHEYGLTNKILLKKEIFE